MNGSHNLKNLSLTAATIVLLFGAACDGIGGLMSSPSQGNPPDPAAPLETSDFVQLNVMKLESATEWVIALGDGALAFETDGGAKLNWVKVGETTIRTVSQPATSQHSIGNFQFSGTKLCMIDRFNEKGLYLFDTADENLVQISTESIRPIGGEHGHYWMIDGDLIAVLNYSTSKHGAGHWIKVLDVCDLGAIAITWFSDDPGNSPNAIAIDAATRQIVVRDIEDTFHVYDLDAPSAAADTFTRSAAAGGGGQEPIRFDGRHVAFVDDTQQFTLLDIQTGEFASPLRNPAVDELALRNGTLAYFVDQNADDEGRFGHRCLVGTSDGVSNLYEPVGTYVNGNDSMDGRIGFGNSVAMTPDARYIFVAGDTAVDVDDSERLSVSVDGSAFRPVLDAEDELQVARAAGVVASDKLVAFIVPMSTEAPGVVTVAYAVLP